MVPQPSTQPTSAWAPLMGTAAAGLRMRRVTSSRLSTGLWTALQGGETCDNPSPLLPWIPLSPFFCTRHLLPVRACTHLLVERLHVGYKSNITFLERISTPFACSTNFPFFPLSSFPLPSPLSSHHDTRLPSHPRLPPPLALPVLPVAFICAQHPSGGSTVPHTRASSPAQTLLATCTLNLH